MLRDFDSHAHYNDDSFDEDRAQVLAKMPENNVGLIINAGADIESSIAGIELAKKYP